MIAYHFTGDTRSTLFVPNSRYFRVNQATLSNLYKE